MQLSQQLLYFKWTGNGTHYIDIARCMSLVNRKLHRQQGLWTVGGFKYHMDGAGGEIQIAHAPKVWPVRNALEMAFAHWKKQQKRVYAAGQSSIRPKWQDFKVWLNNAHVTGTELVPRSGGPYDNGATATVVSTSFAEWVKARLVIMETDHADAAHDELHLVEPEMHILGGNNGMTNVGLVYNYQISRANVDEDHSGEPENEAVAEQSVFLRASEPIDETIQEISDNLQTHNDQAPYDTDSMPGGDTNFNEPVVGAFAQVSAADAGRSVSLNGLSAPNGLLEVRAHEQSGTATHHLLMYVVGREAY